MNINNILKRIVCLPILLLSFNSNSDLGNINIRMTANLISSGCTVSSGSKDLTVNMGIWSTKQFTSIQQGTTPVPFYINLEDCGDSASKVTVTFNGSMDTMDNSLLALDKSSTAKNVGLAILDNKGNRVPIGSPSSVYSFSPKAPNVTLSFYGKYIATAIPVSAGSANADTTFTLDYQ